MPEFTARRHRLNIPTAPTTDDPAVLKKYMAEMRQLMMDEFNRLGDDYYNFKKTTYEAGIIPLKQVNNLAVTYERTGVNDSEALEAWQKVLAMGRGSNIPKYVERATRRMAGIERRQDAGRDPRSEPPALSP